MKKINAYEFVTSKDGHISIILLLTFYLAILSAYLLAEMMIQAKGFNAIFALCLGLLVTIIFEYSTFFCAVNSYNIASWICAAASIVVCRGTFEEVAPEFELSFKYFTSWVYTLFAPALIAYLSHKVGESKKPVTSQLRECQNCGSQFESRAFNQVFCSAKCRKESRVKK